jgi:tetratricopeptide (TPR) repeat protein
VDYFLLGSDAIRSKNWSEAISLFRNALRLQPDHFWAQYQAAICFLSANQPDRAEFSLSVCQGRRPEFVWTYLLRGFAYGELGGQALAARRPTEAKLHFAAAEADFLRALELKPDDEARYNLLANRGAVYYRQKRYAEAAQDLREAVALRPGQFAAYTTYAQVLQAQKQLDGAAAQLDRAVQLQPRLALLYRNRAHVHRDRGDRAAALRDFEQAIRLEVPGSELLAGDHTERGRLLHAGGNLAAAVAAYEAALKIDPDHAVAHLSLGTALVELKRAEDAVRAFNAYLKQGAPKSEVYEARGLARIKLHDYAAAVADFSRALELEPRSARLLTYRGKAYLSQDAPKLALPDFEQALRQEPKNADALTGRGNARVKLGLLREATADAEEALGVGKRTPALVYHAARIYAQAVGKLDADPRQASPWVRSRYQDRAVQLLRQAIDLLPAGERAAFWQEYVRADAAMTAIRTHSGFTQLAGAHAK